MSGPPRALLSVYDKTGIVDLAQGLAELGWVLISSSLRHVPASSVGLILLVQPTLAIVWDVLFFARPFGAREGVVAALTLFAIWLGSRRAGHD